MNDEELETTIFLFLSKKEDFLQFLAKSSKTLFSIIDTLDFLEQIGLPPLNQDDFYKFIVKMLHIKIFEKVGDNFSFISENVENYLRSHKITLFLDFIKEDVKKVLFGIKEKYSFPDESIKKNKKNSPILVLEYDDFKELINEFCYPKDNLELNKRLDLFCEIFYNQLDIRDYLAFFCFEIEHSGDKSGLFFLLFYNIFLIRLKTDESLDLIFYNLFREWIVSIKKKEMIVKFLIPLPRISLPKEHKFENETLLKINNEISINRFIWYCFLKKSEYFFKNPTHSHLEYKIRTPFNLFRTLEERNTSYPEMIKKSSEERRLINKKIQEIICLLYLNGIEFKYLEYFSVLPWWFPPKFEEYSKLGELEVGKVEISDIIVNNISQLHPKIIDTQLFSNEKYIIIWHHYRQLFNRDFSNDVILDAFIILEHLFTKGSTSEVTFRLSFNIAFFLAKNLKEFEVIYNFFKKVYGLRSLIVHGEEWDKKLKKMVGDGKEFNSYLDIFTKLKYYVNKSLEKLILLMKENPNVLKNFKDIYFVTNSKILK